MADLAGSWSEASDAGPAVTREAVAAPIAVLRPDASTPRVEEVAPNTPDPTQPDFVRAAVRGGVIGFVLVGAAFGYLGLVAGESAGGSLGLGLFVGFWGGIGWGAMTGASLSVMFRSDDEPQ